MNFDISKYLNNIDTKKIYSFIMQHNENKKCSINFVSYLSSSILHYILDSTGTYT